MPAGSAQRPPEPKAPPPRVLVVEDMVLEALLVIEIVSELGCEPLGPVGSFAEVAEVAATKRVDAAILDVNLGGDLVFDAADELVARKVPLLFVTGYDVARFPARYRHACRLDKPYLRSQLEARISRMLGLLH